MKKKNTFKAAKRSFSPGKSKIQKVDLHLKNNKSINFKKSSFSEIKINLLFMQACCGELFVVVYVFIFDALGYAFFLKI